MLEGLNATRRERFEWGRGTRLECRLGHVAAPERERMLILGRSWRKNRERGDGTLGVGLKKLQGVRAAEVTGQQGERARGTEKVTETAEGAVTKSGAVTVKGVVTAGRNLPLTDGGGSRRLDARLNQG